MSPPPLLGFNNNVRHRGRIFHIQTEDSGVKFPRIVTHLFADGGRIVKTTRTDYSQHLEKADMATVVRGMMKEQHKGMFAALRAGDLDNLLEQVCGPLEAPKSKAADSVKDLTARHDHESAKVLVGSGVSAAPAAAPPPSTQALKAAEPAPVADAQAVIESMQALRDADEPRTKRAISNPNLRKPTPSVAPPPADAFDLDVASLDKIPPKPARLPPTPPPPSLLSTAVPVSAPARPARKSNPAAPRKSRPPIPGRAAPAPPAADASPSSLGRPQTRLAATPQTNARSIFGDGAISEQSLDEVILSYLAEDLEETK